ncbi:aminoglycoside phosphotransferase [Pseudofrankia sp. EUN1h]|nr:aminoglycoside phosphotransferase [Pseudofrankia sp. EUN1h]
MSMARIGWADLPDEVQTAVEDKIGPVLAHASVAGGVNSAVAATLHTAAGPVFVKGIPLDHPQIGSQRRERDINPTVRTLSPRLLWDLETAGWSLLCFEHAPGRHADYTPGSADLPRVAALLNDLAALPCPQVPTIKTVEQRWSAYVPPTQRHHLRGTHLLHTDFAPDNILISADRTLLLDWAWPTIGPAWADPAALLIRLIDAGHLAAAADAWGREQFSSWRDARAEAVTAFTGALAQMWTEIAETDPQPWKQSMASAARRLADRRAN